MSFVRQLQMRLYLYTQISASYFFSTVILLTRESALFYHRSAKINLNIILRILATRSENMSEELLDFAKRTACCYQRNRTL